MAKTKSKSKKKSPKGTKATTTVKAHTRVINGKCVRVAAFHRA